MFGGGEVRHAASSHVYRRGRLATISADSCPASSSASARAANRASRGAAPGSTEKAISNCSQRGACQQAQTRHDIWEPRRGNRSRPGPKTTRHYISSPFRRQDLEPFAADVVPPHPQRSRAAGPGRRRQHLLSLGVAAVPSPFLRGQIAAADAPLSVFIGHLSLLSFERDGRRLSHS